MDENIIIAIQINSLIKLQKKNNFKNAKSKFTVETKWTIAYNIGSEYENKRMFWRNLQPIDFVWVINNLIFWYLIDNHCSKAYHWCSDNLPTGLCFGQKWKMSTNLQVKEMNNFFFKFNCVHLTINLLKCRQKNIFVNKHEQWTYENLCVFNGIIFCHLPLNLGRNLLIEYL